MSALSRNGLQRRRLRALRLMLLLLLLAVAPASSRDATSTGLIYRNPRVYNVQLSFEFSPDADQINRAKDLKLWIPKPRNWDSQRAVRIVSAEPQPQATFEEPEYGNRMFFWDFGEEPERAAYRVDLHFRLESFEVHADVDPQQVGPYDRSSEEYRLYTRSGHTVEITPEVRRLAQQAVQGEKNPYLQAKEILEFVHNKIRYEIRFDRGIRYLLSTSAKDEKTGEERYFGDCSQYAALFIAMCRALGIPARSVYGFVGWRPWMKPEELRDFSKLDTQLSPIGTAGARHRGLTPHMWAEFYLPNVGWIPADPTANSFGALGNWALILSKGRDVKIGPHGPKQHDGYGFQWVLLTEGRVDGFLSGVWNIARIRNAKVTVLHSADPFPADALANYDAYRYPLRDSASTLERWRKRTLTDLWVAIRGRADARAALSEAFQDTPRFQYDRQALVCHVLRRIVGDHRFSEIVARYQDLRVASREPVSTAEFQRLAEKIYGAPLGWFFDQWLTNTELPGFQLANVTTSEQAGGWLVRGDIVQTGSTQFRVPVTVVLETAQGRVDKEVWLDSVRTGFEFRTAANPSRLLLDPNYEIPTGPRPQAYHPLPSP